MTRTPRAGLLPLYLKLYDDTTPDTRSAFDPFLDNVTGALIRAGVDVVRAPVCRVADEFAYAVKRFEAEEADAIVTLHLAYSPSEESAGVLCGTDLPVIMLDTTMDYDYGRDVDPAHLMFNHGIHGVMDLASVLRRRARPFTIVAGHVSESDVISRVADIVRAAKAARVFKATRALRIGEAFQGMGDFAVRPACLRDAFGIVIDEIEAATLAPAIARVSEDDIVAEMDQDTRRFAVRAPRDVHRVSVQTGLGLRAYLEENGYGAVSANFLAFHTADGPVMPFLEMSKAMARGIGYAGEGDVLTASLVGALQRGFGSTTFTEIFCPDWKGDTLFLSHMGEVNPELAAAEPVLLEKPFPYTAARNPAYLACALKPGVATYVNLAPGPNDTFRLIIAPVEILPDSDRDDMSPVIRAWMKPAMPIGAFLERYARLGGTHHSALVYGDHAGALDAFATFLGIDAVRLQNGRQS